jgi:small-conductance mechanosensitive channel
MKNSRAKFLGFLLGIVLLGPIFPVLGFGQVSFPPLTTTSLPDSKAPGDLIRSAPVTIDGEILFRVGGVESYPAERRANEVRERIISLARDPTFDPKTLTTQPADFGIDVMAGRIRLIIVTDPDAQLEGVTRELFASIVIGKTKEAVERYRYYRRSDILLRNILIAIGATLIALGLFFVFRWSLRRVERVARRRYETHIQAFKVRSLELVRAERIRGLFTTVLRLIRWSAYLILFYLYLELILSRFPWTRGLATHLLEWVLDPLENLTSSFIDYLPNFIFIIILTLLTAFALKLIKLFFSGIEQGVLTFSGFEREWAKPTYNLVRILFIAFALVLAYPHIPGSESQAFKGVSIFLGVIFSLGSTSAVSNIIAGYSMIYRRAFKVGDRVQIAEHIGDVLAMRLLTTHLKTIKNEIVVVPNSIILNSNLVNYTTLAQDQGLILHTSVGIGYETPWRQVEAMLLRAAELTPGVLKKPPPFVLHNNLGDFAVNYELNAYCHDSHRMVQIYTELHRNILDQFNEYGIQIMTPAYVGDPESPKVVPKHRWYASPAHQKTKGNAEG